MADHWLVAEHVLVQVGQVLAQGLDSSSGVLGAASERFQVGWSGGDFGAAC